MYLVFTINSFMSCIVMYTGLYSSTTMNHLIWNLNTINCQVPMIQVSITIISYSLRLLVFSILWLMTYYACIHVYLSFIVRPVLFPNSMVGRVGVFNHTQAYDSALYFPTQVFRDTSDMKPCRANLPIIMLGIALLITVNVCLCVSMLFLHKVWNSTGWINRDSVTGSDWPTIRYRNAMVTSVL